MKIEIETSAYNTYTEDFGEIIECARERNMVREILSAWGADGLPESFRNAGVTFVLHRNSGIVFLVNSDYQMCMMNGGKLETFYCPPYNGIAGFIADILIENEPASLDPDDVEYILSAAKEEGATLPDVWADAEMGTR